MKRKRGAVKRKPKKLPVAADVVVDPRLDSVEIEDDDGLDTRMENLSREASAPTSGQHVCLDRPVVNHETAGSAAAKLARVIDSSYAKATVQHVRIGEKEPKSYQQAPVYNKQELDASLLVIKKIMKMNVAAPFNCPVDPIALGIPDYFDIINTPMDFGTICSNLEKGLEYKNSEDVFKDVQRIWDNCCKYNKEGSAILELMKRVKNNFMKQWTAAGLYKEGQTVIDGHQEHLPHNPDLYSESTMRHEEALHLYPVDSTVSSCANLQQHSLSYLNKPQFHQPSPSCGNKFEPPQISHRCPCFLHPGQPQHGHQHHGLAPQHRHHTHLNSVERMNDNLCNQWVNEARPDLMHPFQPSPNCCVSGHSQQRTSLPQSSSSQLPPSQLETDVAQSAVACNNKLPKNVVLHHPTTRSQNLPSSSQVPLSNSPVSHTSQPSPNISSPPHAIAEDEVQDEDLPLTLNPKITNKRGRGATKGKAIEQEIAKSGQDVLEIEFIEGFRKPVRHASHLASGIGIIVRQSPELDFSTSWKKIPESSKQRVYAGLDRWFRIKGLDSDPVVKMYIEEMFYDSYKHLKGRLSDHYRKMVEAGANPKANTPFDWVSLDKWHALCDHFDDPEFQKRSKTNAKNRSCVLNPHTSGSKSSTTRYMEKNELQIRRSQADKGENSVSEREIVKETLDASGYETGNGSGVASCKRNKKSRDESLQHKAIQMKLSMNNDLQDAVSLIKSQQEMIQNQKERLRAYDERAEKQDAEIASLKEGQKELKQLLLALCTQKLS